MLNIVFGLDNFFYQVKKYKGYGILSPLTLKSNDNLMATV